MRSIPFLKKPGFSDCDRVVIIHAGDIGVFMSDELKQLTEREDFKVIGYRQLRDAMRHR